MRKVRVLAVLVPLAFLLIMGWFRAWMSDDGFINVRVIKHLLAGNGPVFNIGERVEVGTSTLWLYLSFLAQLCVPGVDIGWVMVFLGLALSGLAIVFAGLGAGRLDSDSWFPFGLLVFVSLSVVWDFTTSGLETSLGFAWLAACWTGLVFRGTQRRSPQLSSPWWLPWLIGLGPLIRPDFGLFALGFGVMLLVQGQFSWRSGFTTLGWALSTPLLYEIFRAGYYGILVPNTALVKTQASWPLGWHYLWNFIATYGLILPLVVLIWWLLRSRPSWLTITPVVLGLSHWLFVVAIGGDFMHGRFLLPGLWLMWLPVSVVSVRAKDLQLGAIIVTIWAVAAAGWFRPVLWDDQVVNERGFYAEIMGSSPSDLVEVAAWSKRPFSQALEAVVADQSPAFVIADEAATTTADAIVFRAKAERPVLVMSSIGAAGVAVGLDPHIVDRPALSDPIGARLVMPTDQVYRPGHAYRPVSWAAARWTTEAGPISDLASAADIEAAREVLKCGDIPQLLAAMNEPMSPKRFLYNLVLAPKLTKMKIPADPQSARAEICR